MALAGVLAFFLWPPGPPRSRPLDERIAAAMAPDRMIEDRVPFAAMDRHRAYVVARSGVASGETVPMALLGELEQSGNAVGVAAGHLVGRDFVRAEAALARSGDDPAVEPAVEVERAVAARGRGRLSDALNRLDGVLSRNPRHPQALWNRALVLRDLDLPLMAAEAWDASAALGEPGWSAEAKRRASDLRSDRAARAQRWQTVLDACNDDVSGDRLPAREIIAISPATCRRALYEALRLATTRAAVEALAPMAETIDGAMGDTAASTLVRRIAAKDFGARAASVAAYRSLTRAAGVPRVDKERLLGKLRAAGEDDLVLGALTRTGLVADHAAEYVRVARATADPYFAEAADEEEANAQLAAGDPLGAEVRLRRAVRACASREVELRCADLHLTLARLYIELHRPVEAKNVAREALARSRRIGAYWDEKFLFDRLADAARFERDHSLMRAYLGEAMLRAKGDCRQVRYAQELFAIADVGELRFADARRDIDRAPLCDRPPTLVRAVVLAELSRFDGTPAEASALRDGLRRARAERKWTPGELAHADAIEGRLLAVRDPAAAKAQLRRAIADADRLAAGDASAAKARSYAYRTLASLAAGEGDFAAALETIAAAARARLEPTCALGISVDDERTAIVARGADGRLLHHVDVQRTRRDPDPQTLVPPDIVAALAACRRVDVLAPAPTYARPGVLPPHIAWSYRGTGRPPAPPSAHPTVVTVANAEPPPDLELPRLAPADASAVDGAVMVDLRGAMATPARVAQAMADADVVEIHAHGFVDLGLSDASVIALSPQADGRFALGAREIAAAKLSRAPLVILAACHAARVAPYLHDAWSLPSAFLLAGARAVLAPATPIPDADAGAFFRAVETRVLAGEDAAVALRDERVRRLAVDPESWVRDVLLFD
ncbi:MAG TPA: CHAT domain-containing protein [Haliangiales bacterium]|nr:CHAT domain-containing protein [Haliangiales bacterium]